MQFRAILFDLDGTLLDTLEDLALSVNAVLKRFGHPEHPLDSYRYFVGDGIEMLLRRSLPEGAITEKYVGKLVQAVQEEYRNRWMDHTRPYPGIPELLTRLEDKVIPKVILSNKPHEFTVLTVEALLPSWRFAAVVGSKPGLPRKPDPAGALAIAQDLKIHPREFVYLGDTATDMQTAIAAGMYPVGALWGFRPAKELTDSGAKKLVQSPPEVISFF